MKCFVPFKKWWGRKFSDNFAAGKNGKDETEEKEFKNIHAYIPGDAERFRAICDGHVPADIA